MAKMFDEQENDDLERINYWYMEYLSSNYRNEDVSIWVRRFEHFLCQKNETLDELENSFEALIDNLRKKNIRVSMDEKISKWTDALPAKWDEFLMELKKKPSFPELYPKEVINEIKAKFRKECLKKRELIDEMEKNLNKISLDVINEINKRVYICLAAKDFMKYDIKRGCYIDENMNPLDFVKNFCEGTYNLKLTMTNS
ncbi:hypothetical protein Hanom_Chr06g00543261 [Helianthus anomalus]